MLASDRHNDGVGGLSLYKLGSGLCVHADVDSHTFKTDLHIVLETFDIGLEALVVGIAQDTAEPGLLLKEYNGMPRLSRIFCGLHTTDTTTDDDDFLGMVGLLYVQLIDVSKLQVNRIDRAEAIVTPEQQYAEIDAIFWQ